MKDDRTQRPLSRADAKAEAARILDHAIRSAGVTNEFVGDALGVSATRIRKQRSDDSGDLDAVISLADLVRMDETLFAPLMQRLLSVRERIHGPPAEVTRERQLFRVVEADSELHAASMAAMRDGVISDHECVAIQERLERSEQERERLVTTMGRRR